MPVLIRHLRQLKTVVFLHGCLICTLPLVLLGIVTLNISTLSIMGPSMITLNVLTLSIMNAKTSCHNQDKFIAKEYLQIHYNCLEAIYKLCKPHSLFTKVFKMFSYERLG
jgi:hypothetical protein